ncbi:MULTISPECIES: hypothetical protein [Mameliella]|nr:MULTISPECIES: hypothetical protein [Mameliella]MDD9730294.1 hypothetical protein [Mameliella sp. AT18]
MRFHLFRRNPRSPELRDLPPHLLRDIGLPPCPFRPPHPFDRPW